MNDTALFNKRNFFSALPIWPARLLIAGLLLLMTYGIFVFDLSAHLSSQGKKGLDLACYKHIVERVRVGEGYYVAANTELTRQGYPTQSVFNWRLPFLAWALGYIPNLIIARVFAICLAFVPLLIWLEISRNELSFPLRAAGCLLMLGGPVYGFIDNLYFAHEFWCGILIVLSIFSYAKGWRRISLISGISALMIRELALPFIMVMLVLSYIERKFRETGFWVCGILAFFAVMVLHSIQVNTVTEHVQTASINPWVTLAGWKFSLGTASMHPYLFLLPPWFTAVFVPATLFGLLGWNDVLGRRLAWTVSAYLVLFLFIGQSFNLYWGVIYVNLLPIGIIFTGRSMKDLYRSACVDAGMCLRPKKRKEPSAP
ncbi:MAG TPA: hypothetical protein P5244_15095 [Syntrophales bacterium]|nr:hypothetical protein [Phycisphaerae bacterium]HRR42557.1 hypothetical protein [Syntrophales bacterium]